MAEKNNVNAAYEAVEVAKATGTIKKGVNEVTKTVEKGTAKLVLYANDVNPKEIVMHLAPLCKEKGVPCVEVGTKEELGAAAGLPLGTAAVSIIKEGEAKNLIKNISEAE
ncbi:MAG: L7Ae/L30e/S12e/Gadd45 family ribosomal protein [Candidatus Woesearchaeota archaeon]